MRCVAVIGAAGFIGSHVVQCFERAGITTRAIDVRLPINKHQADCDWVIGDVGDPAFSARAITGCDAVIYVAGHSLPATANSNIGEEIRHHVEKTVRTAEVSHNLGVNTFVFASSGGTVYGQDSDEPLREDSPTRPRNAYGISKLAIEHYLRLIRHMRGMNCISLRIANPFGEGQNARGAQGFVAAAMESSVTGKILSIWGDGSTVRDFIYVGDVANAFVQAVRYDGPYSEINIGYGEGHSLKEIVFKTASATERTINISYESERTIDVATNVLDISLAAKELGWTPRVTIDDAIRRTADWWLGSL